MSKTYIFYNIYNRIIRLLIGFDTNKDGSSLLAVVKIDMNEYKVAAETISILDDRTSKYLEAFKEWL
ncbi:MAG: hypothetical protein WAM42_26090 [Candidatus Nitrosopolaris sp.]